MTQHKHGNSPSSRRPHEIGRRKLHKDWRVWLAVALMLAAMAMHVLSLDESVVPRIFGN